MKVIIIGANSFLGRALSAHFYHRGDEVVAIARRRTGCSPYAKFVAWDGVTLAGWADELNHAQAVINLAGRSVNCRYNEQNKAEILESRVQTTRLIGRAIAQVTHPPEVWLNSSTATIYRHREDDGENHPHTEASGEIGEDFSMNVATEWERAFQQSEVAVRKVALRTAIVLGEEQGSVFDVLSALTRKGLGGTMGGGRQMFSWIHIGDFCRAVHHCIERTTLEGSINIVSPNAESNQALMASLRKVWGVKLGLPATRWMLRVGAFFMRTETELVLKSRWVSPERLIQDGFNFQYHSLEQALQSLKERIRDK